MNPPRYSLRISPKAKRILVRLAPDRGLEVVLPRGTSPRRAETLARDAVARRLDWIERTAERMRGQGLNPALDPDLDQLPAPPSLPDLLELRALNEAWPVLAAAATNRKAEVLENAGRLVVRGDALEGCAALREWVRKRASAVLPERLRHVSLRIGLDGYERVVVRVQRTRWGSLSSRGTVSLNAKLLFLPGELAEHVLVHELCHLRHRNHGAGFKRELARHAPDWQRLERELNRAGPRYVPAWMNPA